MIISHSRQFIFVHVHKAGGTSIERALDPHLAWNDLILGGSPFGERIQGPYKKRFGLNKHSAVSEIEAVCGARYLDDYFLFALVRHPLARLCSIYNFVATTVNAWAVRQNIALADVARVMTPQDAKKTPGLAWTSSRVFLNTKGFSEFIRHDDIRKAPGFRSQVRLLSRSAGGKPAGTIYRLEDHPEWESDLSDRLKLDFHLPHDNRSGLRLADPEAITAEDKVLVEDLFRADYEAFGYRS
ncbi:MAG TPA: sulfotransferase family 2 domain-containing protein [Rhizomicrobium sp.]